MAVIEASEIYTVNATAKYINATPQDQKTVRVMGGGTLYYKSTDAVSSTSNDGNVASGAVSSALTSGIWVAATNALPSTILVQSSEGETETATVTGNESIAGTLTVSGATALNGGITADTDKFTVANTSGATHVAGDFDVATPKFTVASATGNTVIAGSLAANGGITCDSTKFTVADTSGDTAVGGTLGVTGATTVTGGVAASAGQPGALWATGAQTVAGATAATLHNNSTPTANTAYWNEVWVPLNFTVTGIAFLIGDTGGTDKVNLGLYTSAGAKLGSTIQDASVTCGTNATFQKVPLITPVNLVGPRRVFITFQADGNTCRFQALHSASLMNITGSVAATANTVPASITPGTTYTADVGPIAFLY